MTKRASPTSAADALASAIAGLLQLHPIKRAGRSRALIDEAKAVLAAVGDAAIVEALKDATYEQVARELNVSTSAINKAVSRHRARARALTTNDQQGER